MEASEGDVVQNSPFFECEKPVSPETDGSARNIVRQYSIWSSQLYEDPNEKSRIEECEKLIKMMSQELFQIKEKIEERKFDRQHVLSRLERLNYQERGLRGCAVSDGAILSSLKKELDKLSFTNNAYQERAILPYLSDKEIDVHNLHFWMRHRTNNLVQEKQLLRGENLIPQREDGALCLSMEELNHRIQRLSFLLRGTFPRISMGEAKRIRRELSQLEWAREKAFANAPVKGKIWSTLGSKLAIGDQINDIEKKSDEARKKQMALRAKIKQVKKDLKAVDKDSSCLEKKLSDVLRRKKEAHECIHKIRKGYSEME